MRMDPVRGILLACFVFTASSSMALPEIKSSRPTDKAFLGDAAGQEEDIQILESKDILLLDDEKLLAAYIDVIVEIDATRTFHSTSGFAPKEFRRYKKLLKYRLQLLFEISRRKIEIPAEVK